MKNGFEKEQKMLSFNFVCSTKDEDAGTILYSGPFCSSSESIEFCCVSVFVGLVGILGGARLFLFRETPAQFAVYKSPEQGLNLSRS